MIGPKKRGVSWTFLFRVPDLKELPRCYVAQSWAERHRGIPHWTGRSVNTVYSRYLGKCFGDFALIDFAGTVATNFILAKRGALATYHPLITNGLFDLTSPSRAWCSVS
jgi:hypothetical protein